MKKLIISLVFAAFAIAQNPVVRELGCTASSASGTTYTCNIGVAPAAYVSTVKYWFVADVANTGVASINFNSLGAAVIKKVAGGVTTDLVANDIRAGQYVALAYDGTNMQMLSQVGNAASGGSAFNPIDPTTVSFQDHFTSGDVVTFRIGALGWANTGVTTAATASYVGNVVGHPGVLRLATDTTIDHGSTLTAGAISSSIMDAGLSSTKDWDSYYVFSPGANSTTIAGIVMGVGISNASTAVATGSLAIQLRYDTSLGTPDTNLMMIVCNATGSAGCSTVTPGTNANASLVDSGITPAAGTWYQLHIWHRMTGVGGLESIYMSLNGASTAPGYKTFCSSGCDGVISHQPTTGGLGPQVHYVNHAGTVAKDIDIDYIAYMMTGLQLY